MKLQTYPKCCHERVTFKCLCGCGVINYFTSVDNNRTVRICDKMSCLSEGVKMINEYEQFKKEGELDMSCVVCSGEATHRVKKKDRKLFLCSDKVCQKEVKEGLY